MHVQTCSLRSERQSEARQTLQLDSWAALWATSAHPWRVLEVKESLLTRRSVTSKTSAQASMSAQLYSRNSCSPRIAPGCRLSSCCTDVTSRPVTSGPTLRSDGDWHIGFAQGMWQGDVSQHNNLLVHCGIILGQHCNIGPRHIA